MFGCQTITLGKNVAAYDITGAVTICGEGIVHNRRNEISTTVGMKG